MSTTPTKRRFLTPHKALALSQQGAYERVAEKIDNFVRAAALGTSARKPSSSVLIPIKSIRCAPNECDLVAEALRDIGFKAEVKLEVTDDPSAAGGKRATPTHILVDWSEAKAKQ